MEMQNINSWTCQQLVTEVFHELNQHVGIADSCVEYLCDDEVYRVLDQEQKEVLIDLQKQMKTIRELTDALRIWRSEQVSERTSGTIPTPSIHAPLTVRGTHPTSLTHNPYFNGAWDAPYTR